MKRPRCENRGRIHSQRAAAGTPYGTTPDNTTVHNYSAVVRLTYGKTHILLDGDAQKEAEDNMIATYPSTDL